VICCIEPQKIPSAGYSSCCANGSQFRLVMHTEHAGVEPTFRGQLHDFFIALATICLWLSMPSGSVPWPHSADY
jgi:hypothetical protein